MMQATVAAGRRVAVAPSRANRVPLSARRMTPIRAQLKDQQPDPKTGKNFYSSQAKPKSPIAPKGQDNEVANAVLTPTQEAINGRAAMLGFVAALISETVTHRSVWGQLVGRFNGNGEQVAAPFGTSILLFIGIVAIVTVATVVPKARIGEQVDSRSVGPFTPKAERNIGRTAQVGFAALIILEILKGSPLLA